MKKLFHPKKHEKGMTLVEVIVSLALFSITCASLFTAILFAVNSNKNSYFTGQEIEAQANAAENYNDKSNIASGDVAENNVAAGGDNKVKMSVDFGSGVVISNDSVYAFQAKEAGSDKSADYRLRFFDTTENEMKPDPDNGIYWVTIYNYSTSNLVNYFLLESSNNCSFIDASGNSLASDSFGVDAMINGKVQIGIDISSLSGDYIMAYASSADYYSGTPTSLDFGLTTTNFYSNCEKDDTGKVTGYINIYYDGGMFMNKDNWNVVHPDKLII